LNTFLAPCAEHAAGSDAPPQATLTTAEVVVHRQDLHDRQRLPD